MSDQNEEKNVSVSSDELKQVTGGTVKSYEYRLESLKNSDSVRDSSIRLESFRNIDSVRDSSTRCASLRDSESVRDSSSRHASTSLRSNDMEDDGNPFGNH